MSTYGFTRFDIVGDCKSDLLLAIQLAFSGIVRGSGKAKSYKIDPEIGMVFCHDATRAGFVPLPVEHDWKLAAEIAHSWLATFGVVYGNNPVRGEGTDAKGWRVFSHPYGSGVNHITEFVGIQGYWIYHGK